LTELAAESVRAVDARGMVDDVLAQPGQLADALWRVESASVPAGEASGGLLVCGMGGSAIGGDLARSIVGERASAPIRVVRGYALGALAMERALVLCASYTGETEETLDCYAAARQAGAARVALTTGGRLAELARADGVPVIGVPAGMQPRAAVVYMTVAAIECAAACGAAPPLREEIEAAADVLDGLAAEWGPDGGERSLAKRVAHGLAGAASIVVYGGGSAAAVARRWKTQLNENAKAAAYFSELPEANHNEICGFEAAGEEAATRAVFLDVPGADPRLARRVELTARAAETAGLGVERVEAHGETAIERVMSLVLLGDLTSVYAAVLRGIDPTPVAAIERFKRVLAG
jgi:glucose/mannose-6-phosphate isomerase